MTPTDAGDGAAREIPAGRLASFEDEPPAPALTLPTRPSRRASASTTTDAPQQAEQKKKSTQQMPAPAERRGVESSVDSEVGSAKQTKGAVRASNVHIPVALLEPLNETKRTTRMSNGDIIITAIEQTYDQLKSLIHPRPVTGGALFGQRVSRPPRTPITEPVTPLNYRLTTEDYAVLDKLVEELGASSRSHLITVALSAYYHHQQPT